MSTGRWASIPGAAVRRSWRGYDAQPFPRLMWCKSIPCPAHPYAIAHLGLPAANALAGVSNTEFYASRSLLTVLMDTDDPIGYVLPARPAVMFLNGPAFDVDDGCVVARSIPTTIRCLAVGCWVRSGYLDARRRRGYLLAGARLS